jgi:hypothetical protein
MMRVPLCFIGVLGVALPLGFQTAMFHGVADLTLDHVGEASCLAFLLISSAITACYLVLLYGEERADGWAPQPTPKQPISRLSVVLLYLYGGACYLTFLFSIYEFMGKAGRILDNLGPGFLLYSALGLLVGLIVVSLFFLGALALAGPDDHAVEVFAFPAFLLLRKFSARAWISAFQKATRRFASVRYAVSDGPIGRFLAARLGPGYGTVATPDGPSVLLPGHRFMAVVLLIFLVAYWLSGVEALGQLRELRPWPEGGAPNSVLNYLLLVFIFWNCLLTGITFFVDRFRFPALAALGIFLLLLSFLGSSDHFYATVERRDNVHALPTPQEAFEEAPDAAIVVAAAGGGIQSAAWTSKVLCSLRSDLRSYDVQNKVLAISGVSGGSVGVLFYLRCLEDDQDNAPAKWAQNSSLGAVAWGMTHPDLRRIFIPGPETRWSRADRGWALERSLLKSAQFQRTERRLADPHDPKWPVVLLNATDALTGDPVVFTNSQFPKDNNEKLPSSQNHFLRGFHNLYPGRDVFLETAARMSAAFPYVSPEARPDGLDPRDEKKGVHLGDGGYFDNSGVFALAEWLKAAAMAPGEVTAAHKKRILILQLDAFPDSAPKDVEKLKPWYYQLIFPLQTMLNVRSEGQIVRDDTAGKDLQKLLYGHGYQTTWLLVRYTSAAAPHSMAGAPARTPDSTRGTACSSSPPLSWHLTPAEQQCIEQAWSNVQQQTDQEISLFLRAPSPFSEGACDVKEREVTGGVYLRSCPAR